MKPHEQIRIALIRALDAQLPALDKEIHENPDAVSGMRPPLVSVKVGIRRHNKVWFAVWTAKLTTTEELEGTVEIDDPNQTTLFS